MAEHGLEIDAQLSRLGKVENLSWKNFLSGLGQGEVRATLFLLDPPFEEKFYTER